MSDAGRERSRSGRPETESAPRPEVVYTIGHSTHPIETFIALLDAHGVRTLVDVRTIPGSRRNPQFGQEPLRRVLERAGIGYRFMKELGGLRKTSEESVNAGWRNKSFRGYADYMQTVGFAAAIDELIAIAAEDVTAIMCAEAVPWRCHRSLIADALSVRGITAIDIVAGSRSRPHTLTSFARVSGTAIPYPPE
jgi:uncharacterized protein (DUF488 family)